MNTGNVEPPGVGGGEGGKIMHRVHDGVTDAETSLGTNNKCTIRGWRRKNPLDPLGNARKAEREKKRER